MVVSRSVQFVEELKKLLVHPKSVIDWQSLMVKVAVTKVVDNVRFLMSNILVILVPCPYHMCLLIIEPFFVSILLSRIV